MIAKADIVDDIYLLMEQAEGMQNAVLSMAQNLTDMIQELETRAVLLAWQLDLAVSQHYVLYSKRQVDIIQQAALNDDGRKAIVKLCQLEESRVSGVKAMARSLGQKAPAEGDFTVHLDRGQLLGQNRLVLRHLRDLATQNRNILTKSLHIILGECGRQKALVQKFGVLEAKVYASAAFCGAAGIFGIPQQSLTKRGTSGVVTAPTQTSSRW